MHLVGFIIKIYHNALSYECQIEDINSQDSIQSFKNINGNCKCPGG